MNLAELTQKLLQDYVLTLDQAHLLNSDEYECLLTEQQKHFSLYDETPDYPLILSTSLALLQKGSGHFLMLVSLCNAMTALYQWPGVLESTCFLTLQLQQHWDNLYPAVDRLKGRIQMLEWLVDRWTRYFATHPLNALKLEFIDQLLAAFNNLNQTLIEKLHQETLLSGLIRPLQDQYHKALAEKNSRAAKNQAEQERLQHEAQALAEKRQQRLLQNLDESAENISPAEYLENLDTATLFETARTRRFKDNLILLQQQPLDMSLYVFHRSNTWFAYPYSWTEIASMIAEYNFDEAAWFAALKLFWMQKYDIALIAFEGFFQRFPYYLDCQYYIAKCIEQLDPQAELLLGTLKELLQKLLLLYPELKTASLPNQFKLCSREILDWLGTGG